MQMRYLATACCLALASFAAVPAAAQVTGILTSSEVDVLYGFNSISDSGPVISGSPGSQAEGSGGSYASTSDIGPGVIFFKNGNASSGQFTRAISRTLVDITFANDGDETVTPSLVSQIVPAGFGIFIGRSSCPDDPTACNPSNGLTGNPPRTFNSFSPNLDGPEPESNLLASASFTFRIYANDFVAYELTGDLSLVYGGGGGNPNIITSNIAQAEADLNGFAAEPLFNSSNFIGYSWNTTDIDVDFEEGTLLAPGESATLTYETIVETYTGASCLGGSRPGCLIAYSSFGDPVSRRVGGTATALADSSVFSAFSAFGDFSSFIEPQSEVGTDPNGLLFDEFAFRTPVFSNGQLTLVLTAVPEPASWAMLIAGFGLVGATMRRRRQLTA